MKYCYSQDEEIYNNTSDSTDIEDVRIEAVQELGLEIGDTFYVGEAKLHLPVIDVDDVIERLNEDACSECGESVEYWPDCTTEEKKELSTKINQVFTDWLLKTNNIPEFYSVENAVSYTVTKELYDGANS